MSSSMRTTSSPAPRAGVPPVRVIGEGQLGPWLAGELRRDPPAGLEHLPWVPYERLGEEVACVVMRRPGAALTAEEAGKTARRVWRSINLVNLRENVEPTPG